LNRKNTKTDILDVIKRWVESYSPDIFINCGDMTAKPEKALTHLNRLQNDCPQTKFLFAHGNHDIYGENSTHAYE
jgi:metallophosphoesterase superfamily enzyme